MQSSVLEQQEFDELLQDEMSIPPSKKNNYTNIEAESKINLQNSTQLSIISNLDLVTSLYQAIEDEKEGIIYDICLNERQFLTQIYKNQNPLVYAFKKSVKSFRSMIQLYYYKDPLIILVSFLSVAKGDYQTIECIMNYGVDPNNQWTESLNAMIKAEIGDSLFHILYRRVCTQSGDYLLQQKFAELLLSKGANPNLKNDDKITPLYLIVQIPQIRTLKWAINYNIKVSKKFDFDKTGGHQKWTLCHSAANLGYLKLLHELSYAEVNIFRRSIYNNSPKASCKSSLPIIKYIRKMEKDCLEKHFLSKQAHQVNTLGTKSFRVFNDRISNSIHNRQSNFEASFDDQNRKDLTESIYYNESSLGVPGDLISVINESSFFRSGFQQDESIHSLVTQSSQNFQGIFSQDSCDQLLYLISQPLYQSLFVMALIQLIEFKLRHNVIFRCALIPTLLIHINQIRKNVQASLSVNFYQNLCSTIHWQIKSQHSVITLMNLKASQKITEELTINQSVLRLRNKLSKNVQYDLHNDWNYDDSEQYYHDVMTLVESRCDLEVPFCSSKTTLLQYEQFQKSIFKKKISPQKQRPTQKIFSYDSMSASLRIINPQRKNLNFLNQTLGSMFGANDLNQSVQGKKQQYPQDVSQSKNQSLRSSNIFNQKSFQKLQTEDLNGTIQPEQDNLVAVMRKNNTLIYFKQQI